MISRFPTEGQRALSTPGAPPPTEHELSLVRQLVYRGASGVDLQPVQLRALAEARRAGGLLGSIGVGRGKALILLLLPVVLSSVRPLYLCPAGLIEGVVLAEAAKWRPYFQVRLDTMVRSYELLSTRPDLLKDLAPDLIMLDEAQHVSNPRAARTRRLLAYLKEQPRCRLAAVSGTLTTKSIRDYAHLAEAALGDRSPVPRGGSDLSSWAAVIDADGQPTPDDLRHVEPLCDQYWQPDVWRRACMTQKQRREVAREALRCHLDRTPGVVLTRQASCPSSLIIRRVCEPEVPSAVRWCMDEADRSGCTPDGQRYFATDGALASHKRQLVQGFYYTWNWHETPDTTRTKWLQRRAAYDAGMRYLLSRQLPGMDAPSQIEAACDVPGSIPGWFLVCRRHWLEIKPEADPETVPVYVSPYLVEHAARWLESLSEPALLWYRYHAMGEMLRRCGVDVRGRGESPPDTARPVALSVDVHGDGLNLQAWRVNRVIGCMSSGKKWEQLLGRTHRLGQRADPVVCDVYQHHPLERRALERALDGARYVQATTGQDQKLLLARVLDGAGAIQQL